MITQFQGDNLDLLPTLAQRSVQTIVTSPPYFGLRDYGLPPSTWPAIAYTPMAGLPPVVIPAWAGCLGLEADPLAYVGHLVHVFRLARPALAGDGVMWLNLGDSYAMDSKWGGASGGKNETSRKGGLSRAQRRTGLKDKDLIGIPWRVAYALQADGWWLRSDVVWEKPNAMPESVTDRPTKAHEYIFLLANSKAYYYDAAAIAEPARHYCTNETRNARTVWSIPTQAYSGAHYAPMPMALAERCIKAGSRPGDTVLDMFGGSGTTARAAVALGRKAVLIELNPDYLALQDARTAAVQLTMAAA